MTKDKDSSPSSPDLKRREALAKLAQISVYTAPAVITLLVPNNVHAQTSYATTIPWAQASCMYNDDLGEQGNVALGNDAGWSSNWMPNDTAGDCGD